MMAAVVVPRILLKVRITSETCFYCLHRARPLQLVCDLCVRVNVCINTHHEALENLMFCLTKVCLFFWEGGIGSISLWIDARSLPWYIFGFCDMFVYLLLHAIVSLVHLTIPSEDGLSS